MKIQNVEIKVKDTSATGSTIPANKYIFLDKENKKYELNRIYDGSPLVEAWGLWNGSYNLISISDISSIIDEGDRD